MTTILVVEDDWAVAEFITLVLEDAQYVVCLAADGLAALAVLTTVQPALVLADVQMPNMAGTTLCQRLAMDLRYQAIPRVLMSASDYSVAQVPYITAFLAKPFTIDVLLHTVQRYAHSQG